MLSSVRPIYVLNIRKQGINTDIGENITSNNLKKEQKYYSFHSTNIVPTYYIPPPLAHLLPLFAKALFVRVY